MKKRFLMVGGKWLLGFLLLNMLLGYVLGVVGKSMDSQPLASYKLKALPEVTESANAFSILPKDSYDLDEYDLRYEIIGILHDNWDMQEAQRVLAANRGNLDLLEQANDIGFLNSETDWNELGVSRSGLELLASLNRLESRVYSEQGEVDKAFQSWQRGLKFAEMIKNDAVLTLSSFTRGSDMVDEQLSALHRLISRQKISAAMLKQAYETLESASDLHNDGYELTYSGELRMFDSALQGIFTESIWERIKLFRYFGMSDVMGEPKPIIVRIVEDWGRIFAPKYFIQKETTLNSYRPVLARLQRNVDIICGAEMDWTSPASAPTPSQWYDVFKPNSLSDLGANGEAALLENYRARSQPRCLTSMHLRALKLNIAIRRYEIERGKPLENVLELVPEFINKLPIDPMSNAPLVFDKATKSIVSLGTDMVLGELADQKIYSPMCQHDTACKLSPMVPFDYQQAEYNYDTGRWSEIFDIEPDDNSLEVEVVE